MNFIKRISFHGIEKCLEYQLIYDYLLIKYQSFDKDIYIHIFI